MSLMNSEDWHGLIELALAELKPCPCCGAGATRAALGGQTWRGVHGYSDPQYVTLYHDCQRPDDDPFVSMNMQLRCRSLDDMVERWNRATP